MHVTQTENRQDHSPPFYILNVNTGSDVTALQVLSSTFLSFTLAPIPTPIHSPPAVPPLTPPSSKIPRTQPQFQIWPGRMWVGGGTEGGTTICAETLREGEEGDCAPLRSPLCRTCTAWVTESRLLWSSNTHSHAFIRFHCNQLCITDYKKHSIRHLEITLHTKKIKILELN